MATEWKSDGGLLYRLTQAQGYNCDEINITQVAGRRSTEVRQSLATVLAGILNKLPEGDLTDQLLALAEDAARYRFMRDGLHIDKARRLIENEGELLDAEIDAERAK